MRVLVCGGKDFKDYKHLCKVLDTLHREQPFSIVIQGASRGATTLAKKWADERGVTYLKFTANWNKWGKRATYLRNKRIIEEGKPDLVVAFPGGHATERMLRHCHEHYLNVIEVEIINEVT